MTNLILCGGSGTRLWPISRSLMPKQFVKFFDNRSLFQMTVGRNCQLCDNKMIVSNAEQYFLALDQLEELHQENNFYLLEPIGRNTAPAIALACMALDPEEIVLVTPSDHLIKNEIEYVKVVKKAQILASENYLVTFGIQPTFPEIGFGYIEADGDNVKAFHEKPDIATATMYLGSDHYYWNSGMFCFKVGVFLEELAKYSPVIFNTCRIAYENKLYLQDSQIKIKLDDMLSIPEDSIDYAVMEKSNIVKVLTANIMWSDLGSFDALYEELPKDIYGNTINKKHISIDSTKNLVFGNDRIIATIDIDDLIIVDTGDALLISRKGSSQKVKKVVEALKNGKSELQNIHLTTHRPWGTFTVLENTSGYKIKRIEVKPGKRLSMQKHFHRNEHWIVVSGTATVIVGNERKLVRPNESTYIKMGEIHRLENEGRIPVILIEAQVGEYTGEDDIIRIEDDFQRNNY